MRSLAILSSAAAIQNGLVLAASPILSRLFSPDDFGSAGLLYALTAMPMTISTAHYYLAVTQTGKRVEWINIIALSLSSILLTSFLAWIVVIIIHLDPALGGDYSRQLGSLLLLIPISIMLEASLAVGRIWELRRANYRSLFRNRLIETISMIVIQLLAGVLGFGAIGLVGGRLLGMGAAGSDVFFGIFRSIGRSGRRALHIGKMKEMAHRYWRFPAYTTPAELLGSLCRQIPPLFLGSYFSLEAVGLYWLANRVLERPALLFGKEISRVLTQQFADSRDGGAQTPTLLIKSTLVLAALSAPAFLVVIAFGPEAFALLFGSAWKHAGSYARWMSLYAFVQLIALPARTATIFNGLQRSYAIVESVRALLGAASISAAAELSHDDVTAMAAFSVVQAVMMAGYVAAVFLIVRKRYLAKVGVARIKTAGSRD